MLAYNTLQVFWKNRQGACTSLHTIFLGRSGTTYNTDFPGAFSKMDLGLQKSKLIMHLATLLP
jgi:hypothetical protein